MIRRPSTQTGASDPEDLLTGIRMPYKGKRSARRSPGNYPPWSRRDLPRAAAGVPRHRPAVEQGAGSSIGFWLDLQKDVDLYDEITAAKGTAARASLSGGREVLIKDSRSRVGRDRKRRVHSPGARTSKAGSGTSRRWAAAAASLWNRVCRSCATQSRRSPGKPSDRLTPPLDPAHIPAGQDAGDPGLNDAACRRRAGRRRHA